MNQVKNSEKLYNYSQHLCKSFGNPAFFQHKIRNICLVDS